MHRCSVGRGRRGLATAKSCSLMSCVRARRCSLSLADRRIASVLAFRHLSSRRSRHPRVRRFGLPSGSARGRPYLHAHAERAVRPGETDCRPLSVRGSGRPPLTPISEEDSLPYTVIGLRDQTSQFTETGRPGRADGPGLELWGTCVASPIRLIAAGLSAWTVNQAMRALGLW